MDIIIAKFKLKQHAIKDYYTNLNNDKIKIKNIRYNIDFILKNLDKVDNYSINQLLEKLPNPTQHPYT